LSIAFAIAESLLDSEATTLFVTHYPQITSLVSIYSNAKNIHLKTSIELSNHHNSTEGIKFLHEIGSGPCDLKSGYGIL
jgi:DNA mismatch repair ATPase MutS